MDATAVELFAGVGGFRLGLQNAGWRVAWSNQWEPQRRKQWASDCYIERFGPDGHSNEDIATVKTRRIPRHDLLVGGFPCQDYSVATTLSKAAGLEGKKGVLWWEIFRIAKAKRPNYLLLENVDRLLRSPHDQRGRDFGVMLWCLSSLGYAVEWRVVNASDYGAPQKRRRIFILAARRSTKLGKAISEGTDKQAWLFGNGFFARTFPVLPFQSRAITTETPHKVLDRSVKKVSEGFEFDFRNSGVMTKGKIWTYPVKPDPEPTVPLGNILERDVSEEFFIPPQDERKWKHLKGAKALQRTLESGFVYHYSEGAIPFPDRLDQAARTIVTGEGGLYPSRFKHLILDPQRGKLRVLTPLECERLNQFPDNWTASMPTRNRYFCMGNALVVGLVERMGCQLMKWVEPEKSGAARPAKKVLVATRGG